MTDIVLISAYQAIGKQVAELVGKQEIILVQPNSDFDPFPIQITNLYKNLPEIMSNPVKYKSGSKYTKPKKKRK